MHARTANLPHSWLDSPISSSIGSIWLAGHLQDKRDIRTDRMRVLGRYALVLVLNGKCRYHDASGRKLDLVPGDVLFLEPDLPHAYGNDGKPWEQAYIVFSGPAFDLLQTSPTFQAHQPVWHLEPIGMWFRRLKELLYPAETSVPAEGLQTIGRLVQLLTEMATTDASARKRTANAWLEQSIKLLGEPQQNGWAHPREVAQSVGQSYENFRKRFAAETGSSPSKFQTKRRIDMACAAIYSGTDNFKQLADSLGFCDVYHFSKVFRQFVGSPPSVYRRSVRGG